MGNVVPCLSLPDGQTEARVQQFHGKLKEVCLEDGALKVLDFAAEEEVVKCMAVAFAGTKTCEPDAECSWALGPEFEDLDDPRRLEAFAFLMRLCCGGSWMHRQPHGVVLGIDNADGGFGAVLLARLFPRGFSADTGFMEDERSIARTVARRDVRRNLPPVLTARSLKKVRVEMLARIDALMAGQHHGHSTYASGPHIYVNVVAVHPDAQGRGFCGKSMRAISRAADTLQLPCYLETGSERNTKIYGRFGYEVKERRTLTAPNSDAFEDFFFMVRPPQS